MKKLLAAAFIAAVTLLLHACGGGSSPETAASEHADPQTEPATTQTESAHKFAASALAADLPVVSPNASAVTLSAADLVGFLNSYRNSPDQSKQLLGAEVERKLAQYGISLTNSGFQINVAADSGTSNLISCDALKTGAGVLGPLAPPGPGTTGP